MNFHHGCVHGERCSFGMCIFYYCERFSKGNNGIQNHHSGNNSEIYEYWKCFRPCFSFNFQFHSVQRSPVPMKHHSKFYLFPWIYEQFIAVASIQTRQFTCDSWKRWSKVIRNWFHFLCHCHSWWESTSHSGGILDETVYGSRSIRLWKFIGQMWRVRLKPTKST